VPRFATDRGAPRRNGCGSRRGNRTAGTPQTEHVRHAQARRRERPPKASTPGRRGKRRELVIEVPDVNEVRADGSDSLEVRRDLVHGIGQQGLAFLSTSRSKAFAELADVLDETFVGASGIGAAPSVLHANARLDLRDKRELAAIAADSRLSNDHVESVNLSRSNRQPIPGVLALEPLGLNLTQVRAHMGRRK
jgi:hypothetical protein